MSSNEQTVSELIACPFCGQKDAFVEQLNSDASVVICQGRVDKYSACLARGPVGVRQSHYEVQPGYAAAVAAWNLQAEQHKGEPVGKLMRDKCQNIVIVPIGDPHITDGMLVYTSADAGELERLREGAHQDGLLRVRYGREIETLRAKLAERESQLNRVRESLQREYWDEYAGLDEVRSLLDAALSDSAEPSNDLCAEGAHEFVPFNSECVKCGERYSAEQGEPVERADFEAAYSKEVKVTEVAFMTNADGSYILPIVDMAWRMWQARGRKEPKA